ncbi:Hypothetical protein NCS54_00215500 [Fusarium falciforme]|uniref:Hypothetical protein n=1 Tax=Fusarium falciforme TaxID=195108 RepID=UPI002300F347|nr:Hypothetical protein NCS54_00215500 [Fusarium falciforme]WAO84925.1 Hypothetical protein NCS54_00215500 [Fusarium falciforme]
MTAYNLLASKDHGQVATATATATDRGEDDRKIPHTLKEWAPSWFWRVGVSILLIAIPVAHIVLVAMVAYLNNKEQSPFGDDVLHSCGASVLLEAKQPSSLHLQPNSIATEVPALYYLGSNISDFNFFYNSSDIVGVFAGTSARSSYIADFRSAIVASFYTSDTLISHANGSTDGFESAVAGLGGTSQAARMGQRDLWRNVRIPFLELLPGYDPDDPSAWVSVPADMVVPYASLIGIPIRGGSFNRTGNSTLTVHAHYQTLSCKGILNATDWLEDGSSKLFYHSHPSSDP